MIFDKASLKDIEKWVELRIAYLEEDSGKMEQDTLFSIRHHLPEYFKKHLNHDLIVFVAKDESEIVGCAFLLIVEKPMSPAFITGQTGIVLNVYMQVEYRHHGYAKHLMKMLLDDAVKKELSTVELKATDDGYHLYKSIGFTDATEKYQQMIWKNKKWVIIFWKW